MAQKTISWGDGTSDNITVDYSGNVGNSQMIVTSVPNNTVYERTKTITFKTLGGIVIGSLSIKQLPGSRAYSAAYSKGFK